MCALFSFHAFLFNLCDQKGNSVISHILNYIFSFTSFVLYSSAVLHLGNIYFHRKQLRHGQEGVEMGTDAEIKWASHLLQIDEVGIKRALTTKITVSLYELVIKGYS